MKILLSAVVLVITSSTLAGCGKPVPSIQGHNINKQAERFDSCIKNLPKPAMPSSTTSVNAVDTQWAEVVETCNDIARNQSECTTDTKDCIPDRYTAL